MKIDPSMPSHSIPDPTPVPSPSPTASVGLCGDVNEDGLVDSLDLTVLKRYVLRKIDDSKIAKRLADVNEDGVIDSLDVSILKRYILRKIPKLPY